jgi:protein-tyrosine phosphatase
VAAGGRRLRWCSLFRSGATHLLSDLDRKRLADLGIRTAVDLRSNWERQEYPHGLIGQEDLLYFVCDHNHVGGNLSQMLRHPGLEATNLRHAMIETYRELPYELSKVYRQLFRSVAAEPLPLVFNCAAGTDRTGVAAALLLGALGVSWEDVVADYLLTQKCVPKITRMIYASTSGANLQRFDAHEVAPLFIADRIYLEAMREAIVTRNGSIEGFLLSQLGLERQLLEALRERLLD